MSDKLRSELIGLTNVARMMNVSVTEIKEALQGPQPFQVRGRQLPPPAKWTPQPLFLLGQVMDAAEEES